MLDPDTVLDTKGLYCPEPVMLLHSTVRKAPAGALIRLEATDPSTQRDVPKFCEYLNHQLVSASEEDGVFIYLIRRNSGN